ncbi:MAG TPA: hypothetical protein VM432_01055 [Bdellovibrionales bacterium]|nr:hypothetical protein [Bdellovibrionales bacterium]
MPTTENDRRNQQQTILEKPSLPDHDRSKDPGMHKANPDHPIADPDIDKDLTDESEIAPPDQAFQQILEDGLNATQGHILEDPNNTLTSEPEEGYDDKDPENRGDSTVDEGDRH